MGRGMVSIFCVPFAAVQYMAYMFFVHELFSFLFGNLLQMVWSSLLNFKFMHCCYLDVFWGPCDL